MATIAIMNKKWRTLANQSHSDAGPRFASRCAKMPGQNGDGLSQADNKRFPTLID